MLSVKYMSNIEEDTLNVFMWLIDKALHHDAFQQQVSHLKEFKYRMQRFKMSQGQNKMHFSNAKGSTNKLR